MARYNCSMQHLQPAIDSLEAAERCAEALIEVVPAVTRTIRLLMRAEGGSDLSLPQFRALGYVRRHPHTSLSGLAEHLGLSAPAVSRLIDALVARGLVVRRPSETDRRYLGLELSHAGAERLARAQAYAARELAAMLEALDAPERAEIVRALEPLRAIFTPSAQRGASESSPVGGATSDDSRQRDAGFDAGGRTGRTS